MTTTSEADKKPTLTEEAYRAMLIRFLEQAELEFGSDLPISTLKILLRLSPKGSTPMSQILKSNNLSGAGVSRVVSTLAGYTKDNRRVVDKPYLYLEDNPADRRYKNVVMTDAGKQFVNRVLASIYPY